MANDRLLVLLSGEVIGVLERGDEPTSLSFVYEPSYVATSTVALSSSLPLRQAPFPARAVLPYLRGLLPENPQTLQLWADRFGTVPADVFAMLSSMGWDCPGAVQFCREQDLQALHSREDEHIPVSDDYIAQRLRGLARQPAGWSMPQEHWSLGGQQEKFALALIGGQWHEARGSAATTHIFKPGIPHLRSQALVEHATMVAASQVGVEVARTQFLTFGDQSAIVVERFDREISGRGIRRVHQEDFCQALRRLPEAKYESRGGPTLRDMANLLRRQCDDLEAAALAVADFVAINLVAGAPDGHSKNISLIHQTAGNWVAPLYDLATGLVYDKANVEREVAVAIGGERSSSRIRAEQWRKTAKTLGLDAGDVIARVRQLAAEFPDAFERALADSAAGHDAKEVRQRSSEPIAQHCQRILAQLQ